MAVAGVASRLRVGKRSGAAHRDVLRPLLVFAASRVLVLLAAATGALVATSRPVQSGPWPVIPGTGSDAVNGLLRWDSAWYAEVAARGYGTEAVDPRNAFFPLYPLLCRAVAFPLGVSVSTAGLLVATVAGAAATVLVWLLGRRLADEAGADRMAALFAFFPGSFVFSMAYAEGVFLALAAGCLLALDSRRWILAGLLAALATSSRPNAVALGAACAWAAFVALRRDRAWRSVAAPLMAPVGILAFFAYLAVRTGDPLAWFTVQRQTWGERLDVTAQVDRVALVLESPLSPAGGLNTWLPVLGGLAMVAAWVALLRWRPPGPIIAYAAVASALVMVSATIGARPRMVLGAFPLVMALAWAARGSTFAAVLAVCAGSTALLTVITVATIGATP